MSDRSEPKTPADEGPVHRPVGRPVPERAKLPGDVARCPGYSAEGEWREGCNDCLRRTSPPADPERVWMMTPPVLVVFECDARISP